MGKLSNPIARKHWHVLLIVPLVVIVMTLPTLPRLFNGDAFWLHSTGTDPILRMWDAWHIGKALTGQAELFYTRDMFHPAGASLALQSYNLPHALLQLWLTQLMPADSATNLLFMLMLAFNGFCGYALLRHLVKDDWAAVFGAVVIILGISFSGKRTVADLICIGTIPLTLYCFHRACFEERRGFAALAGFCAGITAFIGIYSFGFILLSVAIYAVFLAPSRWRQPRFWRLLIAFALVCAAISVLRLYPMAVDRTVFGTGLERYEDWNISVDLLTYFVFSNNPITSDMLHTLFNVPAGARYDIGYLGYINIFFLAFALLFTKRRGRLLPWAALFLFFALMRLGDYLTLNTVEYPEIALPNGILRAAFPALFGQIGVPDYYVYAQVSPLAVLSSFGLARLLRGRSARTRALTALIAILILALEFYAPLAGKSLPDGATAFVEQLKAEPEQDIKLINLPSSSFNAYPMYIQTLTDFPIAHGNLWRLAESTQRYLDRNLLLGAWRRGENPRCQDNEAAYLQAVDALTAEGFSHIALHRWLRKSVLHEDSFFRPPAAYEDGLVSLYRVSDLSLNCLPPPPELAGISQFLQSPWGERRRGQSLLSFHPRAPIASDDFAYLDRLIKNTSDWGGLLHLYSSGGGGEIQAAPGLDIDMNDFAEDMQLLYVLYQAGAADSALMAATPPLHRYHECGRKILDDGAVSERWLRREFSCALFASPPALRIDYDNGGRLANMLATFDDDGLELQMRWDTLPWPKHAFSVQLFDKGGSKVYNQDYVVDDFYLAQHRIDFPELPAGDYALVFILYDFKTGAIASGEAGVDGIYFERAWQFASFRRE